MQENLEPLYASADEDAVGRLRLGVAGNGDLRWAVADITRPVESLRRRLDPSPVAAIALGRSMAAAALLLRFSTKYPGRLRVDVLGDGPLGKIQAEVDSSGNMRAILEHLRFPGVDGRALDVGAAVGKGLFRVSQESERRPEPWISQTELASGEIGEDLVHFLHQSQQVRSAALLTTKPAPTGIVAAGGLLVEALPGASEESLTALEKNLADLKDIGSLLQEGGADQLLAAALFGLEPQDLEAHDLRYQCSCSREVLLKRLLALPAEDLESVGNEQGEAILECAFCLGQFVFSVDDLRVN